VSDASMQQIGTFMDPGQQAIGLRDLVLHHRWVGDQPIFSLRTIARRHTDPDSVFLRFLSYNTYLMRVRVALATALADFAGRDGAMDLLKALHVDPGTVLKEVGDPLCDAVFPPGVSWLCKQADDVVNFIISRGATETAIKAACEALGTADVVKLVLRAVSVPDEIPIGEKPALFSRAPEIGDALNGDATDRYDLAGLCEVWTADVRDSLLDRWGIARDSQHVALGQLESSVYVGDGLLIGSKDGRIVETERRPYTTRGIHREFRALDMLADDELFAQKGALLARINMGVGTVDMYLTHLYFGTGLVSQASWWWALGMIVPGTHEPTNAEREAVRSAQLAELGDFIQETRRPENIVMVCGDLNIDGTGNNADYAGLMAVQQLMTKHNLIDVWASQRGQDPGGIGGGTGGDFNAICGVLQAGDSRFCKDPSSIGGGYRIDYILMERPRAQHAFMLDVTRVRRRPFTRPQATDGETFMSDHLGLDCTLLASRK
jgi:hypothetical protein